MTIPVEYHMVHPCALLEKYAIFSVQQQGANGIPAPLQAHPVQQPIQTPILWQPQTQPQLPTQQLAPRQPEIKVITRRKAHSIHSKSKTRILD